MVIAVCKLYATICSMQQPEKKVKRAYNVADAVMLISSGTIIKSAKDHAEALETTDSTFTAGFFEEQERRIETAIHDILGADNAADLRQATYVLEEAHAATIKELGLTKTLIERKYAATPARRDELLNTLGFDSLYARASGGNQHVMGELLSRFDSNLTPSIQDELIGKGLPKARLTALRTAATANEGYTGKNMIQEGQKDTRTELSNSDIEALNGIYAMVTDVCAMAQRQFNNEPALRDRFIFSRVSNQQSSYHTNGSKTTPPPPAAGV